MKIWKFTLSITDTQKLRMPKGAKVLTVQNQRGNPVLWAMVDDTAPFETRTFATYGTGITIPGDEIGQYVGTYQSREGEWVFHVFELGRGGRGDGKGNRA